MILARGNKLQNFVSRSDVNLPNRGNQCDYNIIERTLEVDDNFWIHAERKTIALLEDVSGR
jgi:hypothetical protein